MTTNYSRSRALAAWIASTVSGLRVVDDMAAGNRDFYWPCAELVELNATERPVGCGHVDHRVKVGGVAQADGKFYQEPVDYRLTVQSPGTTAKSGSEVCANICKTIRDELRLLKMENAFPLALVDVAPNPDETYRARSIEVIGQAPETPDLTVKPFGFRVALTLRVVFSEVMRRTQPAILGSELDYEIGVF